MWRSLLISVAYMKIEACMQIETGIKGEPGVLPQCSSMSSGKALHQPITYMQARIPGRLLSTLYLIIVVMKYKVGAAVITFQS